jgi:serine/threonine protein phosphatase PrpC
MPVISKTHIGLVRKNNEDSLLVREPHLFAIADGMGGYAAGEVASKEALKVLDAYAPKLEGLTGQELIDAVRSIISRINADVYEMAASKEEYKGMGTTITGVYLPGHNVACVFNVGDSRLYLWRNGSLCQITKDHSLVAAMVAKGEITKDQAFAHSKKNLLLKGIGVEKYVEADVFEMKVSADDILLLCSDGLSDMLRDKEIAKLLHVNGGMQAKSDALLEQALLKGGKDNISFIIIGLNDSEEVDQHGNR